MTSIVTGNTNSLLVVAMMRALLGVSQAAYEPAAYSLIADAVPKKKLPTANSSIIASLFMGGGLCALNILLISRVGWRMCLNIMGGLGLIIGATSLVLMKEPERSEKSEECAAHFEQQEKESIVEKFKNSFIDLVKNPVTRWCSLAGAGRYIAMFSCDYFLPLFFILSFPENKAQFSILYACIQMFMGFTSSIVGGIVCNKLGSKRYA